MDQSMYDMLVEARVRTWNAHTEQIIDLVNLFADTYDYTTNDELIKRLIDERAHVYNEFSKRIGD